MIFTVILPLPPSANRLFANVPGKGRVKTRAYKNWRKAAILTIFAQVRADRRIGGPVDLEICVPDGMRGDLDNRLKALIEKHVRHVPHPAENFRRRLELLVAGFEAHDADKLRAHPLHARDAPLHFAERHVERVANLLRPIHHRRAEAIHLHAGLLQLL